MSAYLCTLNQVKARVGLALDDVIDDALITTFLAGVSARIEAECKRRFEYSSETEEFVGNQCELIARRFPIDETIAPVFSLMVTTSQGWQSVVTDWIVRMGCIITLPNELGTEKQKLRVVYTGGYALPVDSSGGIQFESFGPQLPPDLTEAAVQQCAYWYKNKDRFGLTSVSQQGGSISIATLDLLPFVAETIKNYERWVA